MSPPNLAYAIQSCDDAAPVESTNRNPFLHEAAPATDDLRIELAAMQAIGTALDRIEDPDARARVLRWATERFDQAAAPPSSEAVIAVPDAADDPLSVDAMADLFEPRDPGPATAPAWTREEVLPDESAAGPDALTAADPFVEHAESDEGYSNVAEQRSEGAEEPPQSLSGMLHDFVDDFQKVVQEWNASDQ